MRLTALPNLFDSMRDFFGEKLEIPVPHKVCPRQIFSLILETDPSKFSAVRAQQHVSLKQVLISLS